MKKKILSVILSVFLLVSGVILLPTFVSAASVSGDFEYTMNSNKEVEITKYTGNAENLVLPSQIEGNQVVSIGTFAFEKCTSLQSVKIPDGIQYIANAAFSDCTSLKEVQIGNSVSSIKGSAFFGCTSLTSVFIPASVHTIGNNVFTRCTALSSIEVDENNEAYASQDGALFNKEKTTLIYCPSALKNKDFTIPDGVIKIEKVALSESKNLNSLYIPASLETIKSSGIENCTNLVSIEVNENNANFCSQDGVLFNKDKTVLYVYPAKSQGVSYTVPDTVTEIGSKAFNQCANLNEAALSSNMTKVGLYTFYGCTQMQKIIVPESITSMDSKAFAGCPAEMVISGTKGSYAETFANEQGFVFTETGKSKIIGDVNGDGVLNILDATEIQLYIVSNGTYPIDTSVADVNGDEKIDILDVTEIQLQIVKL